jgi:hypothetical protein
MLATGTDADTAARALEGASGILRDAIARLGAAD